MDSRVYFSTLCLFLCISCGLIAIGTKDLVYQDVEIQNVSYTSGGVTLRAFLVKPRDLKSPIPGLMVFHGFSSSKEAILPLVIEIVKNGYIVLAPDLRGHGKSEGKANFNLNEITDVETGLQFLKMQTEVDSSKIGFLGQSLGGAVALISGAILNATTVISISTFANLTAWSKEVGFLGLHRIAYFFHSDFPHEKDDQELLSPINYVQSLKSLLVIHGSNDHYIPNYHAEDLYNQADGLGIRTNNILISGGDHDLPHQVILSNLLPWLKTTLNSSQSSENVSENSQLIFLLLMGLTAATILFFFLTLLLGGYLLLDHYKLISSVKMDNISKDNTEHQIKPTKYIIMIIGLYISIHIFTEIGIALLLPVWKIEGGSILAKTLLASLIMGIAYQNQKLPHRIENGKILMIKITYLLLGVLAIFLFTIFFGSFTYFPFLGTANIFLNLPVLLFIAAAIILDEFLFRYFIYQQCTTLALTEIAHGILHVILFSLPKLVIIATLLFVFDLFEIRLLLYAMGFFLLIGTFTYLIRRLFSFFSAVSFSLGINLFFYLTMMTTLFVS